jgi:hypothetical protein
MMIVFTFDHLCQKRRLLASCCRCQYGDFSEKHIFLHKDSKFFLILQLFWQFFCIIVELLFCKSQIEVVYQVEWPVLCKCRDSC